MKLWMMHLIPQDNLNQGLGQNVLFITPIQVEGETYVQNQHQYMDQFINLNWICHAQEYTSVGYHKQFLK